MDDGLEINRGVKVNTVLRVIYIRLFYLFVFFLICRISCSYRSDDYDHFLIGQHINTMVTVWCMLREIARSFFWLNPAVCPYQFKHGFSGFLLKKKQKQKQKKTLVQLHRLFLINDTKQFTEFKISSFVLVIRCRDPRSPINGKQVNTKNHTTQESLRFSYATFSVFLVLGLCIIIIIIIIIIITFILSSAYVASKFSHRQPMFILTIVCFM